MAGLELSTEARRVGDLWPPAAVSAADEPIRTSWTAGPGRSRWADAVDELRTLQAAYEACRDQLPEALVDSRTAELLEGVCGVDLDALGVDLPRGFGRD